MWSLLEFFPEDYLINILDIGAALNEQPPYQSLVEAGRARIIGFEPDATECERLNQEYGPPHKFYPHFIGDGKPATFHETNWNLTGSLFEPNAPLLDKFWNLGEAMTQIAEHFVNTTRLDDIEEINDIDFVKIDVQGGELSVFRNALRILSGAVLVQTEVEFVELYKDQPMFADVDIFLRSQGFQFHSFDGFGMRAFKPLIFDDDLNRGARQCLWSDALYVRNWMRLDELPATKLRNFAIIAHDVLQSYDLAHLILAAFDKKKGSSLSSQYVDRMTSLPAIPLQSLWLQKGEVRITSATRKKEPSPAELNQLIALFNAGNLAELERRARTLSEKHPDTGFVWKALGAAMQKQGKNGLSALSRAAELLPEDAEAQNNLGNVQQYLGQRDEAMASYKRALALNPNYAQAHYNLGIAQQSYSLMHEALASYQEALHLNADLLEIHSRLCNVQHALGALDDAVLSYTRSLEVNPDKIETYMDLGNLLSESGYFEQATSCFRRALEIDPGFKPAQDGLKEALRLSEQ